MRAIVRGSSASRWRIVCPDEPYVRRYLLRNGSLDRSSADAVYSSRRHAIQVLKTYFKVKKIGSEMVLGSDGNLRIRETHYETL